MCNDPKPAMGLFSNDLARDENGRGLDKDSAREVCPLCWTPMRIIAGRFRSRALQSPAGEATRPTSDRLRETLFNVLAPRIRDARFLDLYAGSGAVGIEALSRGAALAVFVESAQAALAALRSNLARLEISDGFRIHSAGVATFLRRRYAGAAPRFDLVFLDPPWDAAAEYATALGLLGGVAQEILAPGAFVIAEHRRKQPLEDAYLALGRFRVLEQGDAALSFYSIAHGVE
jgi:16S rRNA (guanine966-N2)-methyltransferase